MSSGLKYSGEGGGGGPFSDDAKTYYDPYLRDLALTVEPEVEPGTRWEYNNYHPLLLGMILERTTDRPVATYLSQKIWQRSEEHTSELQSRQYLVCRLLLEKK